MAAFTAKDPPDRQVFEACWDKILSDEGITIRVLEKCGFALSRTERSFANARGEEIEEVVMVLMEER